MTMNKPWESQDRWKDICVCLQEPEAVVIVFRVLDHNALIPSGHQEAQL